MPQSVQSKVGSPNQRKKKEACPEENEYYYKFLLKMPYYYSVEERPLEKKAGSFASPRNYVYLLDFLKKHTLFYISTCLSKSEKNKDLKNKN